MEMHWMSFFASFIIFLPNQVNGARTLGSPHKQEGSSHMWEEKPTQSGKSLDSHVTSELANQLSIDHVSRK